LSEVLADAIAAGLSVVLGRLSREVWLLGSTIRHLLMSLPISIRSYTSRSTGSWRVDLFAVSLLRELLVIRLRVLLGQPRETRIDRLSLRYTSVLQVYRRSELLPADCLLLLGR
jgi:hypothetical protein